MRGDRLGCSGVNMKVLVYKDAETGRGNGGPELKPCAHLTFSCFSLMMSVRFLPSTCSW
jgi:hypothetical protein